MVEIPNNRSDEDLLALLLQATAPKPPPSEQIDVDATAQTNHNPTDWDDEPAPPPNEPAPPPAIVAPGELDLQDLMTPREMAETIVDLMETAMELVLLPLYRKASFTEGEFAHAKLLLAQHRNKKVADAISDDDLNLLERVEQFDEYKREIPFTPDEKKRLVKYLAPVLRGKNVQLSPEAALLAVTGVIMAPRVCRCWQIITKNLPKKCA